MATQTTPTLRPPWPIAAAALGFAALVAGFVLAPPMARRAVVEPAWAVERLLLVDGADGQAHVVVVERDGPAGTATASDRLSRLTVRRADTGEVSATRVVQGAARPQTPEGDDGAAFVWVRFDGPEAPIALALPDLAPASAPGEAPKGPLPTAPADVCRTRRVQLPGGASLKLTEGDRSQVDPGLLPGETPPPEPERDEHGHAAGPPPSTARGPVYVEGGFLCEPGSALRAPLLAGDEGLALLVHRPDTPLDRQPLISAVAADATRRWTVAGESLLPDELRDVEGSRFALRWVRRVSPERLVVGIEWWAPGTRRWFLTGVDLTRGERAWVVPAAPG